MDRSQKEKAVADFKNILEEAEAVIVTQYKGINAEAINDLRTQSRDSNVSFKVTKNRLINRVTYQQFRLNINKVYKKPSSMNILRPLPFF